MKIAIVKLSALGDILHAMVVLQAIKKSFPNMKIDWIVEEMFYEVLEHNPDINAIHTVNLKALKKDKSKFFSELKKLRQYKSYRYDLVIDLQGLIKSAFVARILGKSVGFDRHSIRESAASWLYSRDYFIPYEKNVIQRNLSLVEKALKTSFSEVFLEEKQAFLYFEQADKMKIEKYFESEAKTIVYMLGSSWESKVYPKEKFVEVIQNIEAKHLLVWGNENELASAHYIAEYTDAQVVHKMTLNELKALVTQADLVIGADSGPTHFAWALNRPSITIFGPTPSQRNTCATDINKVIDCGNVVDARNLDKENLCIRNIEAAQIVSMAKELL